MVLFDAYTRLCSAVVDLLHSGHCLGLPVFLMSFYSNGSESPSKVKANPLAHLKNRIPLLGPVIYDVCLTGSFTDFFFYR